MFDAVEALRPDRRRGRHDARPALDRWVLANPVITSPILGASRPDQLVDAVKALDTPVDGALLARLDELTYEHRFGDNAV